MTVGPTVKPTSCVSTPCAASASTRSAPSASVARWSGRWVLVRARRAGSGRVQSPTCAVAAGARLGGTSTRTSPVGAQLLGHVVVVGVVGVLVVASNVVRRVVGVLELVVELAVVLVVPGVLAVVTATRGGAAQERPAGPPPHEVARAVRRARPRAGEQGAQGHAGQQHDPDHRRGDEQDRRTRRPDAAGQPAADRDAAPTRRQRRAPRRSRRGRVGRRRGRQSPQIARSTSPPPTPTRSGSGSVLAASRTPAAARRPIGSKKRAQPIEPAEPGVEAVADEPEGREPAREREQRAERRDPDDPQVATVALEEPARGLVVVAAAARRAAGRVGACACRARRAPRGRHSTTNLPARTCAAVPPP